MNKLLGLDLLLLQYVHVPRIKEEDLLFLISLLTMAQPAIVQMG